MQRTELYLGGEWVEPSGRDVIAVENPATEEVVATVPAGTAADVDRAVAAAREAFGTWASSAPQVRAQHLRRLAEVLETRADQLAETITLEMGCPRRVSAKVQVGMPLRVLRSYVKVVASHRYEETVGNSLVVKEPVGVVGAITPWNYPLQQVMAKVAPALAAGCTVVLKPSELTPLVAYALFDAIAEAGFPPGVVNLVPGTGNLVGEAIAGHPDVDMVSFTGSTAVGRQVARLAADRVAWVALELGGKSANVILDDADLIAAVKVGVANAFLNSGQTCTAWTRMLVHRSRYDGAVAALAAATEKYTLGDPFDETVRLGPLVSAAQRDRVVGYIARGLDEGGRLVAGGPTPPCPRRATSSHPPCSPTSTPTPPSPRRRSSDRCSSSSRSTTTNTPSRWPTTRGTGSRARSGSNDQNLWMALGGVT